jgi:hypothetical protein
MAQPAALLTAAVAVLTAIHGLLPAQAPPGKSVPTRDVRSLRACLPDDVFAILEVAEGRKAIADLAAALGPVPANLSETSRVGIGAGFVALRAMVGEPEELAELLAAGGAAAGIRIAAGRPELLAVLEPQDADLAAAWLGKHATKLHCRVAGGRVALASSGSALDELQGRLGMPPPAADRRADWPGAGDAWQGTEIARALVDLERLRAASGGRDLLSPSLPGLARFLFAPLLGALDGSARLAASLHGGDRLQLEVRVPAAMPAPWPQLLPAGGGGRTIAAPPPEALAVFALDRGLRPLFRDPAAFLSPADTTALRSFLSIADQIDGHSSSFVDDLIGGLVEPITMYVLPPPAIADGEAAPPILLPGFCLLARVRSPAVEPVLLRTAQAFVLIANSERGRKRQRPFATRVVRGEVHGLVAEPTEWRGPGRPPVEQGLSPALLFGHGHVAIATTAASAERMLAQAAGPPATVRGDGLELRGPAISAAIAQSRRPLELDRVLREGATEVEAARFFEDLGAVLAAVAALQVAVEYGPDATALRLVLRRQR